MTDNDRPAWFALSVRKYWSKYGWSTSTVRIDGPTLDNPIHIASPGHNYERDAARALGIEGYETMTWDEQREMVYFSIDELWVARKTDLHPVKYTA